MIDKNENGNWTTSLLIWGWLIIYYHGVAFFCFTVFLCTNLIFLFYNKLFVYFPFLSSAPPLLTAQKYKLTTPYCFVLDVPVYLHNNRKNIKLMTIVFVIVDVDYRRQIQSILTDRCFIVLIFEHVSEACKFSLKHFITDFFKPFLYFLFQRVQQKLS